MTERDCSSRERTKFAHERERERGKGGRDDENASVQVQEIHISYREKHWEMDRRPFNLAQCCFPLKSAWHLSGGILNGNPRTLVTDHTVRFSKETPLRTFKIFFFCAFILKNIGSSLFAFVSHAAVRMIIRNVFALLQRARTHWDARNAAETSQPLSRKHCLLARNAL